MKSILMTTSAVLLVTGFAAGQAQAACPEDIDAFNREYEETLQNAAAGDALSTSEQAQLFGLRTAAENLHQAGNAEMCAEVIQRANLMLESAIAPQVIKPDELIGREVVNAQDENLGEVEDVMLDPISGRIAYVVVEHGGFLGIGDDLFAVPWRAMQFVPGDDRTLLLDIQEDKLENAPRFSREDESPLERREWVTSVHTYYGVNPYWQDEVGAMAMQYGGGGATPAATGGGTGAEGETKTIVVPITEPGAEAKPEDQSQSGDQHDQSQTEGQTETQTTDSQSAAEPQTQAANLAGTQPPAEGAGSGSEQISMLVSRIDELEQQVQTLSERVPGEEVTQAVSRLEERVQQLSEQVPGEELKQQITQLQEQIAALGDGSAGPAQDTGGAGQGGQPAAVVVGPDQGAQTGHQESEQQIGQQQPGQQSAQQPDQAGTASQQAGQQGSQQQAGQQEVAAQGATGEPTPPAAEAATQEGPPCEQQVAQLEEDLQRAEELGVEIEDARSEFEEAQAMLNNNSEALCRAAIKRAHEKLTSVGFEPTQVN